MASRILKTGTNQITTPYNAAHKAVDVVKYKSKLDTIIAHTAGKVVFCQTGHKNNKGAKGNASYGNCVKIDHGSGYVTLYAHLNKVYVKLGDEVVQGQRIGEMGNTGNSYGAHLHFEVRRNNKHIDPTPYLEADLPLPEAPQVLYKVYTNKWLPEVTNCNDINANGYAGVVNKNMTALMVRATIGTVRYRVHLVEGGWLPWVTDYTDHAGVRGRAIDAVQMELLDAPGYVIKYRVSPKRRNNWYGWCTNKTDRTGDGYAGVFGNPIDCIQIKIEEAV